MTDARIVRTRASLRAAIIELASQKPVTEITVSELAAEADINRVTFYKHYASPAEALREALYSELDDARETVLANEAESSDACYGDLMGGLDLVLDHIERHRCLYELSFADPDDGAVPSVLSQHFSQTVSMCLTKRAEAGVTTPEFDIDIVASYFGAGLVGAIHMWVRERDRDRQKLRKSLATLIPTWWDPANF